MPTQQQEQRQQQSDDEAMPAQEFELAYEFRHYSKQDKEFTNLLEVLGTPKLEIREGETIAGTRQ